MPCLIGEQFSFDVFRCHNANYFSNTTQQIWGINPLNFFWERDYLYNCFVHSVYDGDTITCAKIDLGFGINKMAKLRLYGINCSEIKNGGIEARDYLRNIVLNKNIRIKTHYDRKGKYGRYLASVFFNGIDVNKEMVRLGLAQNYIV